MLNTIFTDDVNNSTGETNGSITDEYQLSSPSQYDLDQTDIVLSPINSYDKIKALISDAQQSINIYAESFSDMDIINELINAASNNQSLTVQVIAQSVTIDGVNYNVNALNKVKSQIPSNMTVLLCNSPDLYMHAKVITVDETYFYIGSVNVSSTSYFYNRELGIILNNSNIAGIINSQFNSDFTYQSNQAGTVVYPLPSSADSW